jgi:hypothetical protein
MSGASRHSVPWTFGRESLCVLGIVLGQGVDAATGRGCVYSAPYGQLFVKR